MSEMKWNWAYYPYLDPPEKQAESALKAGYIKVVNKDEADKVIEELEQKLARAQLVLQLNKPEALFSNLETMSRLSHEKDVVARRERHQKYKRCLAMAMWCWCVKELNRYGDQDYMDFAEKWRKRWLELAEKFKEAK